MDAEVKHVKLGELVYMMPTPKNCGRVIKIAKKGKVWNTVRVKWIDGTIHDITEAGLRPLIPEMRQRKADLLQLFEFKNKLKAFEIED